MASTYELVGGIADGKIIACYVPPSDLDWLWVPMMRGPDFYGYCFVEQKRQFHYQGIYSSKERKNGERPEHR